MAKKSFPILTVRLDKIVGGGQALGTLENGRKAFVWGGLPGELVEFQVTKKKSSMIEGFVVNVIEVSEDRILPVNPESYDPIAVTSAGKRERYRNKVEFSWYGTTDEETGQETLSLAFFRRGSKGKVQVTDSMLLPESIVKLGEAIRSMLESRNVSARALKTLLIRCDAAGNCVWQLYVKHEDFSVLTEADVVAIGAQGGEVIYSNPLSPASVITKKLLSVGNVTLTDTILGVPFRYATEGFFQINLPIYEQSLQDMKSWLPAGRPVVDLYSGVGSIGLTIGGDDVTLVEVNEHAVREMQQNITELGRPATAVLAASEQALEYITGDKTIIVDPPRAGLHDSVVERLLEVLPERIVYLSCNPVTQARDVAKLASSYGIRAHQGYNFFPRTPHIEHLVVLDRK